MAGEGPRRIPGKQPEVNLPGRLRRQFKRVRTGVEYLEGLNEDTRAFLFVGAILLMLVTLIVAWTIVVSDFWYVLGIAGFCTGGFFIARHVKRREEAAARLRLCPGCRTVVDRSNGFSPECACPFAAQEALARFLERKEEEEHRKKLEKLERRIDLQERRAREAELVAQAARMAPAPGPEVRIQHRHRHRLRPAASPKSMVVALLLTDDWLRAPSQARRVRRSVGKRDFARSRLHTVNPCEY